MGLRMREHQHGRFHWRITVIGDVFHRDPCRVRAMEQWCLDHVGFAYGKWDAAPVSGKDAIAIFRFVEQDDAFHFLFRWS